MTNHRRHRRGRKGSKTSLSSSAVLSLCCCGRLGLPGFHRGAFNTDLGSEQGETKQHGEGNHHRRPMPPTLARLSSPGTRRPVRTTQPKPQRPEATPRLKENETIQTETVFVRFHLSMALLFHYYIITCRWTSAARCQWCGHPSARACGRGETGTPAPCPACR